MTEETPRTLKDMEKSIQDVALAVNTLVTKIELTANSQTRANHEFRAELKDIDRILFKNNGKSAIPRLEQLEKTTDEILKVLKNQKERSETFWDTVGASIITKVILSVLGLTAIGAGFAYMQWIIVHKGL